MVADKQTKIFPEICLPNNRHITRGMSTFGHTPLRSMDHFFSCCILLNIDYTKYNVKKFPRGFNENRSVFPSSIKCFTENFVRKYLPQL